MLTIRPHHLMCTAGYKGYNYNPESANNWAKVLNEVKKNPKLKVKVVSSEDSFCSHCIHADSNRSTCDKSFIKLLDEKVKAFLGLKDGEVYSFKALREKLFKLMTVQKHEEFCQNCGWWKKGLCRDTFSKV